MPSSAGPNTAGETNLVFAYDLGDSVNSYKGEPATNHHDFDKSVMNQTGFNNWSCYDGNPPYHTWGINQSRTFVTIPGPDGKDTPAMLYHNFNGGFYGPTDWGGIPAAICTSGNQITIQAWVKAADAASVGLAVTPYTYFSLNNGGVEATATNWTLTANWQLISHTHTLSSAGTNNNAILYFFTTNGSSPVRMHITKVGVISGKGRAVQWLPGGTTRSVTQGLVSAVGSGTANIANISFNSSAQPVFDGTNDYIDLGLLNITSTPFTYETVIKTDSITGGYAWILGKAGYNMGLNRYDNYLQFFLYDSSNNLYAAAGGTLNTSSYFHVVGVYTGVNLTLYVNGFPVQTSAGSITVPRNYDGQTTYVGTPNASNLYYQGQIPIVKIYNRALTTAEVAQNYQAYKSRFNLA
jgi:hypothetical protein